MARWLHPSISASNGPRRLALLCASGAIAAALTVAGWSAQQPGAAPAPLVDRKPFSHGTHVSSVWFYRGARTSTSSPDTAHEFDKREVARDCRGCHDFGARDGDGKMTREPRSPMLACASCHYAGLMDFEVQPGFEQGLRAGRGSRSNFEHLDHDALACRECHASMSPDEVVDLSGRTGLPACVECHDEGAEDRIYEPFGDREIDRSKIRSKFLTRLDLAPSMRRADRGPFAHSTHLTAEERVDAATCAACHAGVRTAKADDLHELEYTVGACKECHVQANYAPVVVDRQLEDRSSSVALTFSHADHLGMGAPAKAGAARDGAREEIEAKGCLTCHTASDAVLAPDGSLRPPTYALRDDRAGHRGCMSCHEVPRFIAPSHGEWGSCTACHSFGEGDPKTLRPKSAVERAVVGEVRFRVPFQQHPGISGPPDQACADCHRAPLRKTPSRIAGQRFDHASHLGPSPTAQDCQVCHAAVATAAGSTAIGVPWDESSPGTAPAAQLLTFDLVHCGSCHPGIELDPDSLTTRTRREVPNFSHADHLATSLDPRTGELVTCTSCHTIEAGVYSEEIGVNEAARSCVQCHRHDETHAKWTGSLSAPAVESCAQCHTAGVPRVAEQFTAPSASVVLQGAQHHPPNKRCWECHQDAKPGRLEAVTAVIALRPKPFPSQHGNGRGYPPSCSDCHWAIVNARIEEKDRVTGAMRKLVGHQLAGFPGGEVR